MWNKELLTIAKNKSYYSNFHKSFYNFSVKNMAKIVRLEPIAQQTSVETNGSLLSILINKDLDVLKECGGRGMCATCHVYVDAAWRDKLAPILATEAEMLECTSSERRPESRISCQIKLSAALDGLVLRLPETQQ